MKVIIAGGRDFKNEPLLIQSVNDLMNEQSLENHEFEVISGGAKGADSMGRQLAEGNRLVLHLYPAQWDRFGKSAGYLRNEQMADIADYLLAFWDGKSKGTKHMIDIAERLNIPTTVINY